MKTLKKTLTILLTFSLVFILTSGDPEDSTSVKFDEYVSYLTILDSTNKSLNYSSGKIILENGTIQLNIPQGYKFLNAEQSKFVLSKIWGNPPREDVLGMIFPAEADLYSDSSYSFVISFDPIGYVKDEDADEINYDEMLKELQDAETEVNEERVKSGYEMLHFIGWASKPFYDKTNKVLHWAKEIKFGESEENTLNYEIRLLGRKGVLSLNALATMNELQLVKNDINDIIKIASFTEGNKYSDFDEDNDHIAEWTIGGLVAGKILAKTGIIALLLKNIKLIVLVILGFVGTIWNKLRGKKSVNDDSQETVNITKD
jgi:uncharacterized membrane-anchored protein